MAYLLRAGYTYKTNHSISFIIHHLPSIRKQKAVRSEAGDIQQDDQTSASEWNTASAQNSSQLFPSQRH